MTKKEQQELREEIAQRLVRIMDEKRVGAPELSRKIKVLTDVAIRNYMKARRDPKLIDFIAIAAGLDCSVVDLLPQSILETSSLPSGRTKTRELRFSGDSRDPAEARRVMTRLELLDEDEKLAEEEQRNIERRRRILEAKQRALQELDEAFPDQLNRGSANQS